MKDIFEQRRLNNDFIIEEEDHNSDLDEEYDLQHNIPRFPHEYEDLDCESCEALHDECHFNSLQDTNDASETVHQYTSLTICSSMLLIRSFALKYSLTGECLMDLLSLIDLHCSSDNKIPKNFRTV